MTGRKTNEVRFRVRYAETDQMGIAHHAGYLVWFEMGRTSLCSETGVTYRQIEERGYLLVVSEITCRYRVPFRYDDEVLIRTGVSSIASRSISFHYELFDGSGLNLHASGNSRHLWVDRSTMRPVTAPPDLAEAFRGLLQ